MEGVEEEPMDSGMRLGARASWLSGPLRGVNDASEKLGEDGVVEAGDIHNEGGRLSCERSA